MKRILLQSLLMGLLIILQVSVLNRIPYLNASPNLILIYTFSAGLLRGSVNGMLTGFFGGLIMDVILGQYIGFSSLIYIVIGFLTGLTYQRLSTDVPLVPILISFFSELFYHSYIYIFRFLVRNRLNFGSYFKNIIFPEVVFTIVVSVILFGLLYYGNNLLEDNEKRSALKFV
ncbi:MAG: rod shape-determining protein MreD [Lachnospiraceae bacterium]|nr:rod shape-determining protein MreD [Lachnospiraceae bacterium]